MARQKVTGIRSVLVPAKERLVQSQQSPTRQQSTTPTSFRGTITRSRFDTIQGQISQLATGSQADQLQAERIRQSIKDLQIIEPEPTKPPAAPAPAPVGARVPVGKSPVSAPAITKKQPVAPTPKPPTPATTAPLQTLLNQPLPTPKAPPEDKSITPAEGIKSVEEVVSARKKRLRSRRGRRSTILTGPRGVTDPTGNIVRRTLLG